MHVFLDPKNLISIRFFTAALLVVSRKIWRHPKCSPISNIMDKWWHIHIMGYHTTIMCKKEKIGTLVTIGKIDKKVLIWEVGGGAWRIYF